MFIDNKKKGTYFCYKKDETIFCIDRCLCCLQFKYPVVERHGGLFFFWQNSTSRYVAVYIIGAFIIYGGNDLDAARIYSI